MNTTQYAAYDNQAIWGTGNTEGRARDDAAQWVAQEHRTQVRNMAVAPMSPELAARVESQGGALAFDLVDGVLISR